MISDDKINGIREIYPNAQTMAEAGIDFIYIPAITISTSKGQRTLNALLCPMAHPTGYMTRLFLSEPCEGCGQSANWNTFRILERQWHSWSWQNVPASLTPAQILAAHLRALL